MKGTARVFILSCLAAALLAAALPHTAEAGEVINGARMRMSRKPGALARELLRNLPKQKAKRRRTKRKKGAAGEAGQIEAGVPAEGAVLDDEAEDAGILDLDPDALDLHDALPHVHRGPGRELVGVGVPREHRRERPVIPEPAPVAEPREERPGELLPNAFNQAAAQDREGILPEN